VADHKRYLITLKQWLRESRFPNDRDRLLRTLHILKKLEIKLSVEEKEEIRLLMADTFGVTAAELEELFPEVEQVRPIRMVGEQRGEIPKLSPLLDAYLEMTAGTESPSSFHVFSLLTVLGAALKRRCCLDMTFFKVWPNLSVVLAGPAGGPRKNSAADAAWETIKSGWKGIRIKEIVDATPQALVQDLEGDGSGFIYAPEFRHFFPSQTFMEGTIPLITRLLDNPDYYPVSRITRSAKPLRNVTLSMLGGSTLDWLAKLPSDAQGGGFFTRVLIIHEEKARPPKPELVRGASKELAKMMLSIERSAVGEIKMADDAKRWYDEWYRALKNERPTHPRLILYYNRKQIHLLRLAMLMWLPSRVLRAAHLEVARQLLDWVERPLGDVYRIIGMSKEGEATKQVLDMIKAHGGTMEYEKLAREMKGALSLRGFRMAIDMLVAGGQVQELHSPAARLVAIRELNLVE
jgi:hypothetical protein